MGSRGVSLTYVVQCVLAPWELIKDLNYYSTSDQTRCGSTSMG